ncbi:B-lymphocyte antigen CD20 isoform 2-T4 [Trichechus inunguis]|uniref:B-lymphocyte antigen CD20 isoform X3 n=1 Tax=Trichechus manatus latirostris TaxID=127582 RepID=A0A2Y9RVQ8_TRIMA|nr:B-lymphocyte antigen CD20 isoform X3 [Trichechus manatus latirostris]
MTTPRNSLSRALPAEPMKGPIDMYPVQKINPQRMLSVVGPAQHFFMRESKALGAVQIMNGLFHFALGGLLMIPIGIYAPICVTVWYPLWGGTMVKGKMIMNSLSLFAAISGIILLIMDIFNITLSHFFKMESLQFIKGTKPYVNIYSCESDKNSEGSSLATQYCHGIRSVFLGIFAVMLIFSFFQKLVAAGIAENDWKRLCSRPKANVVLLSAEEKQEQTTEIKEHVIELTEISSQSKNEEEIEIIPVQEEEEEEAEINFPEPPQDQESSPIENDSAP